MILPYLSSERLTNDLIVLSNSILISEAIFFSSFKFELNKIVRRYSNARPFPVIPTFVTVDAGSKLLSASSALALVAAL